MTHQNFHYILYMYNFGQGNFGNIDGDNAAAMRYTEARLEESSHMQKDMPLKKHALKHLALV